MGNMFAWFVVVACFLVTCSNSCSMLTHIEIATRAHSYFSFEGYEEFIPLIQKHLSTFQAGATFPDWGYPMNGFHQAAEIAHWPPFYLTAAEYIQKQYPQPWSEDGERLAVFLMGATSHMVADVLWHSLLNISQGFIVSMSCFGFNCDYDAAHPVADLGGDTVLAVQNDLSYVLEVWDLPVEDIRRIYEISGWPNVTLEVLAEGFAGLYAGTMALRDGGAEVLFPAYAIRSAFLADQFEDFFVGGLDDMAVWTSYCWPQLLGWFTNGPGPNPEICLVMQPDLPTSQLARIPERGFANLPSELLKKTIEVRESLKIEKSGDVSIKISRSKAPIPAKQKTLPMQDNVITEVASTTIYSQYNYSYLGYDIVTIDLNQDSFVDLIVSAPGYSNVSEGKPQIGCVYFLFGNANLSLPALVEIESIAQYKLCGNNSHDRFGHAIAVLDFNQDGILDVAISSPTTNSIQLAYTGKVSVFFGMKGKGNLWSPSNEPDVTIVGEWYTNFGSTLIIGDTNTDDIPDLIIGCPFAQTQVGYQTGYVVVFASSKSYTSGQLLVVSQADLFFNAPFDFNTTGVADHGWWGNTLLYVPASSSSPPYLLVGGNGNFWLNKTTVFHDSGSISLFSLDGSQYARPLALFYGSPVEKLGAQMAIGSMPDVDKSGPVLAVTLPLVNTTETQAGQVVFLSFNGILQFLAKWNSTDWVLPFSALSPLVTTRVNGDQVFSRFGSSVAFVDFVETGSPVPKPVVFVGYPLWTDTSTEEGCVCMWESGLFPIGVVNDPVSSAIEVYTSPSTPGTIMKKDGRFGSTLGFGDMDGDGTTDVIVGAERKSIYSYLGGAVQLFFSNSKSKSS